MECEKRTLIMKVMNKARHTIIIKSAKDIQVVDYVNDTKSTDERH